MELPVTNVNQGLSEALRLLHMEHQREGSRVGEVLAYPEPVLTTYSAPWERVLFSPRRDANPFFHFMESMWMFAGRNDVEWISQYTSQLRQFSDDGRTFHAAYGHRWRNWMRRDQLEWAVTVLRRDKDSRRVVIAMWDPFMDPEFVLQRGKDVPCNTHIYLDTRNEQLNMTVCNRSNDLWLGAYGTNAVHFSMLQELLAAWCKLPMGIYRQFSNNLHLYASQYSKLKEYDPIDTLMHLSDEVKENDVYEHRAIQCYPMVQTNHYGDDIKYWFADLKQFMSNPLVGDKFTWRDNFFRDVAAPMAEAWHARKIKKETGMEQCARILAEDWGLACQQWIQRREDARAGRSDSTAAS